VEAPSPALSMLTHPYRSLREVEGARKDVRAVLARPGTALLWDLGRPMSQRDRRIVHERPGGAALILVLPPAERMEPTEPLLQLIRTARPNGILPHHGLPHVDDLAQVMRRPPSDLAAGITDYLSWRGIRIERDTRQLLRRTIELSSELRTISALARGMYLSRRALGRRFENEGLPVPSHWLHFCRLLRVSLRLQNSQDSIVSAGFRFGYSDGFSLSNQMFRLTGHRPSEARKYLGWEWLLEAWLRIEAEHGGLRPAGPDQSEIERPSEAPAAAPIERPGHKPGGKKRPRRAAG